VNAVDRRAHTWRVLLSLPGRVGMVAPVTPADLQRMSAAMSGVGAAKRPASPAAATVVTS
jgi:hypothetical protein